jgi:hypothetical protein
MEGGERIEIDGRHRELQLFSQLPVWCISVLWIRGRVRISSWVRMDSQWFANR